MPKDHVDIDGEWEVVVFFFFSGMQMWNNQVAWISRHHPLVAVPFFCVYVLEAQYFSLPLLGMYKENMVTLGEDQKYIRLHSLKKTFSCLVLKRECVSSSAWRELWEHISVRCLWVPARPSIRPELMPSLQTTYKNLEPE